MAFDLLEGYEEKKPKAANNFDLLEGYEEPVNNTSTPVKQKVKTDYTYPNRNLTGMSPEEFKNNVNSLYNIPQVPMPQKGDRYVNSDGEVRENLPSFSENHPIISSIPEAGKQLGVRAAKSFPEFGKGLNDLVALVGDKTGLNGLSDFGRSNAQFWENAANNIKTDPKYQGMQGLKSKETFLPTLAGEVGGQATNLLMAMGGGAGGGLVAKAGGLGKLGTGAATFAGTSVPNLAQEGQYLDKIEQFKNINGRMPNAKELKQIQNVALSEKAINTALESVADRLLFGKLFPEGTASKGVKAIGKSVGQQGLTEGLTEAAQEGVSVGAEKLLGLNNDDAKANLARTGEAGLLGMLTGGVIGGASTAASQPYNTQFPENQNLNNAINAVKNVSAQVFNNGKELYNSASEPTAFDLMKNLSNQGTYSPTIENIAPKTAEKIKNKAPESKPAAQLKVDKKIEKIAPKTAQKIQENNEEALTGKVENQYTDEAKNVYYSDKKEALIPQELEEIEQNESGVVIDEDNAEALKGHVKNTETEGIVIDKNDAESLSGHVENKPKQYKVVDDKTVRVDAEPTEEIKKIAPKTAEQIERVKNAENLQANETVGQEGNTNVTPEENKKPANKLLTLKYRVTTSEDGLTSDGLYMEGSNFHTDGNAAYLKDFVNADTSKVAKTTKATDTVEQQMKGFFEKTGKYTVKAEDTGKGFVRPATRHDPKETHRLFKVGEYDNGEPRYVVVNDKYLLNGKDIELYVDDENLYAPISIRKNGEQIGLVMPITMRNMDVNGAVDIKPMKSTAKKANQIPEAGKKVETNQDVDVNKKVESELPEIKKTTVTMKSGKEREIEYVEEIPKGYIEDKGAMTAPRGYTWYHNDKSILSGERKSILVKDKAAEESSVVEKSAGNRTIEGLGTVEEVYTLENGEKQYKINGQWYAQRIIDEAEKLAKYKKYDVSTIRKKIQDKKIDELKDILEKYTSKDREEYFPNLFASSPVGNVPKDIWLEQNMKEVINGSEPKEVKKSEPKKKEVKKKESKKLDDAGEFLQGNRKQDTSLTWDELKDMNDLIRAKNTTKAKVYPKPSIEDLKSEGFTEFQAGVIQNVYNKINAKPAAGYDKNIEHQKQYVDTIKEVMDSVKGYIKSHPDEFTTDLIADAERKYRSWSYDYNKSLFDAVFPDTENKKAANKYSSIFRLYPEYNRKAIIIGGNKFTGALQLDRKTLNDIMKAIEDSKKVKEKGEKVKKEPWEKNFVVLEPDRWNKEYAVANKNSKQVYAKYATKEEAIAAAKRVQEKIDAFKDTKANFVRDYVERRENNKDVTTEELREAFGFRGVNFGNWTNEKERQNFVNFAYDSLYDLAELLNLPPKALSLNGQLGLAYGAQGTGGKKAAAAHYIPEYKDINLTKEYGAGSLAHEWWHALDNYFGNQATNKEYSREWALSLTKGGDLRPEVFEALENLQTQIKKAPFTEEDIKKRAEQLTIQTEARIKRYADSLKQNYAKAQNAVELHKIIDDLVENKEKYKTYSWEDLHEITNKFFKLVPSNRDTLTNRGEFGWFTREITRLNEIEELARKGANKTEYLQNAEKADKQEGGKYWSEDTELGARAFAAYIFDKMANQNIENRFLSRSGNGAILNLDAFKELAEGEERESLTLSTTPKGEERARIFKAFDKLFDTIKTRETDKGVELYAKNGNIVAKREHTIAHLTDKVQVEKSTNAFIGKVKDIVESSPEMQYLRSLARNIEDVEVRLFSQDEINELGNFAGAKFDGYNILVMPNTPIWKVAHEMKHARDLIKNLKSPIGLLSTTNGIIGNTLYKKFYGTKLEWLGEWWYNATKVEKDAYAVESKVKEHYGYSRKISRQNSQHSQRGSGKIKGSGQTGYKKGFFSKAENGEDAHEYAEGTSSRDSSSAMEEDFNGQNKAGSTTGTRGKEVNKNTSDEINQVVRDKVYDWHGNLESDRYDVDKALNSFINLTKHKAKNLSQKTGVKISDKQLREILPFLRERTGFPKSLERDDLRTIFDKLSGSDKAELAKLADSISDKFEKYYTNYKDAKGEQTEESIENHISHIWDLDDKKKSLLTNFITTNSKFAKKRTIGTFVEGIDGIEINGEKVQFKPKTLDYAEILKSSSDNLIKATHDSILANEIKNLKYKGESMVLPASKAPSEWIEVNHPALNKAVYQGAVGEDEIPMLMKTPVKVHPEIADYVNAIFEVQKPNKFWRTFDSLNGMVKQALLGFSGFHGYALSESSIGNAGVGKTLKELNPKKFVDAIKNGNYDVYKNEEAAKRAINAGVQLGTPSDLQRNLTEEALKKIPLVGKALSGAVSANNKILWDVLHNNFKVLAFNTAIENLGENVTKEQERAVAQWVNDSFGGQAWELLGIKKSTIKAASRVLLSPDWNFSTIRQAAAAINSEWADNLINQSPAGKRIAQVLGVGGEKGSKGARGEIGRGFWLRSAIFFTVFYNLINAAFREKDRKEHPELYPKDMKPMDYSIWANSYPMDNIYDRIMPKVFIGRNSDGTSRMLRVGKQFREVPEFLTEPVTKLGGKTSPLINTASQVGLGMGAGDVAKKLTGGEPFLNQDIWDGYGEDAKMRSGMDLAKGRAKALGKSLTPFIASKYIGGKHEPSAWDFFAQTNAGGSKSRVYKQTMAALQSGQEDKIRLIKRHAYQDGLKPAEINKMVGYATKTYQAENSKRYKKDLAEAIGNRDKAAATKIKKDMEKHKLSKEEQKRILGKAFEEYQKSKKN